MSCDFRNEYYKIKSDHDVATAKKVIVKSYVKRLFNYIYNSYNFPKL